MSCEVVDEEPLITHRVEDDDMLAAQTESEIRRLKLPTFVGFQVPPPCSDGKETEQASSEIAKGVLFATLLASCCTQRCSFMLLGLQTVAVAEPFAPFF